MTTGRETTDNIVLCMYFCLIVVLGREASGLVHIIVPSLKFVIEQKGSSRFARKPLENSLIVVLSALFMRLWKVLSLIKPELGCICFLFGHITPVQTNVPPVATASSLSFTAIRVPGSVLLMLHTHVFCFSHFLRTWWHWTPGSESISSPVCFLPVSLFFPLANLSLSSPGHGAFSTSLSSTEKLFQLFFWQGSSKERGGPVEKKQLWRKLNDSTWRKEDSIHLITLTPVSVGWFFFW